MKTTSVKRLLVLVAVGLLSVAGAGLIRNQVRAAQLADKSGHGFNALADDALAAMKKRAGELKIGGVAVVAYFEGDEVKAWSSKMLVVGKRKDEPSTGNNGANLLGIAYTKAAEMADTLKDSGSGVRPPMTGEYGWQGGVIAHAKNGYVIAAFSGGKSEDDVEVSKAGSAVLKGVQ
jgi:hypothetical protein